jgi:transposase
VGRRKEEWLTLEQRAKVAELVMRGQVSRTAAALRFGISPKTIRNILRDVSPPGLTMSAGAGQRAESGGG